MSSPSALGAPPFVKEGWLIYAKIFNQILDSSISEDFATRHVFIDLLVLADEKGIVDMTVAAIARRINAPVEMVDAAIQRLMQPDPDSRSKDEDGRRLILVDPPRQWGWMIVNYRKYRAIRSAEDRREYQAEYHKQHKNGNHELPSTVVNLSEPSQPETTVSTNAYASAYASEEVNKKKVNGNRFDDFWALRWRSDGKKTARTAWPKHAVSPEAEAKILQAAERDKVKYLKRELEKRPHMTTWLNQERYNDESDAEDGIPDCMRGV